MAESYSAETQLSGTYDESARAHTADYWPAAPLREAINLTRGMTMTQQTVPSVTALPSRPDAALNANVRS